MSVSKLVDITQSAASRLLKRYFQTVRNIEPQTVGIIQSLGLVDTEPLKERKSPPLRKDVQIADILQEVKDSYGLPPKPSHIEHLVGRATKAKIYQNHEILQPVVKSDPGRISSAQDIFEKTGEEKFEVGGIDIAEKTQLILQSPHPVRYVIERELFTSHQGLRVRIPSYHTWIMLFGRSLKPRQQHTENYNQLLTTIANASDSGMFSADIHHTIVDIPVEKHSSKTQTQFHMGNKYAVLVGDYFAIRCIHYAERTKTNSVMVAITEGVEEFTTCSFGTNLFHNNEGYPFALSPTATVRDWILYNQKAFGYFKGGLYAALSVQDKEEGTNPSFDANMAKFVANLSLFIKASVELDAVEQSDTFVPSPFLLFSLPALLCQMENPKVFANLRQVQHELKGDHIRELHAFIRKSSALKRTRNFVASFGDEAKRAFRRIAKDQYYVQVVDSLIDAVSEET